MHPLDSIIKKRDGESLTQSEIEQLVRAVVLNGELSLAAGRGQATPFPEATDTITDAQIGSLLMAIFQRGLSREELAHLTTAMRDSGETFDCASLNAFIVDKHSTGGVGDKSSLLIAPTLAAASLDGSPRIAVPMIAGRSLGHTGGTLDKLESIPGFDTQLSLQRLNEVLQECSAAIVGQTPSLVPADRVLYAMRDHTGTVESPYLIAASIMSKKLAENLNGLVLDVKVGSGAFMPTYEKSKLLAQLMVSAGEIAGTRTVALLTTMDEPLGRFSGNWVEVWECVEIMKGVRHPMSADLIELSNVLSGWMLYLAGKSATPQEGAALANHLLESGAAYDAWLKIVCAQGGDPTIFDDPVSFHKPQAYQVLRASQDGYFAAIDCKRAGWAVQRLGAGRAKPGDPVSAHAGIESHVKLGAKANAGDPLFTLFSEDETKLAEACELIHAAIEISHRPPQRPLLIREVIRQV